MNRHFRFVRSNDDQAAVLEMMRRDVLRQIPVLNERGRVVQLLLLDELLISPELSNAVVIMAGGKGTRLRPHGILSQANVACWRPANAGDIA